MDRSLLHAVDSQRALTFGNLRLEPDGTLFRGEDAVHLTPKELAALRVLLASSGRIVTPAQLREILWPDVHVTADSVPRCISSLRSRLGSEALIRTIYKRGYRFESPVHRAESTEQDTLPRLAIVPFAQGMYVPEYLGSAIAEDAGTHLIGLHPATVRVLPRDSVYALFGSGMSAQDVGRKLLADFVLTGAVQASTLFLRVRAEMLRVSDGSQIWTEEVIGPREDYFVVEQRLLGRLTHRLGESLQVSIAASPSVEDQDASDAAAHEAFLIGRYDSRSRDPYCMSNAVEQLRKACDLRRINCASREQIVRVSLSQCLYGYLSPGDAEEQVRRASDAVPDLEQSSATLAALGWILFHVEHNLGFAFRMIDDADLVGSGTWLTTLRAMLSLSRHRFEEARELLEEALHDDPWSPSFNVQLAWANHLAGRAQESLVNAEHCLEMFPGDERAELCAALILAFNNHPQRAAMLAHEVGQRRPRLDIAASIEAYALARASRRNEASTILERLQWAGRERYVLTSFTAAAYAALGDQNGAIAELRTAEKAACPWFFQTLADPRLKSLHGNPEFDRMMRVLESMEVAVAPESEVAV
jgi:DNA-binding winged helix-turn-helix (wHTH) protein